MMMMMMMMMDRICPGVPMQWDAAGARWALAWRDALWMDAGRGRKVDGRIRILGDS